MKPPFLCLLLAAPIAAQIVLKPARVFDRETLHENWAVRLKGDRIEAAGPAASVDPAGRRSPSGRH